jgi:sterol O-acyltransferase
MHKRPNGSSTPNRKDMEYLFTPEQSPESSHSLREALEEARATLDHASTSGTTSEEDYDNLTTSPEAVIVRRRPISKRGSEQPKTLLPAPKLESISTRPQASTTSLSKQEGRPKSRPAALISREDKEFRELVLNGLKRVQDPASSSANGRRRGKFSDLVFTRKFSAFDRQNEQAANSPFHGFFTLFWIAVTLFVVKIGANNWTASGSVLGNNEIMRVMFRRDILVLLVADGVMCGLTGVSWLLQQAVFKGYVDWDREGWILQNVSRRLLVFLCLVATRIRD